MIHKYRAWDKDNSTMLYDSELFHDKSIWWLSKPDCTKRFIVMQFTGLCDSNGKDLDWWEGDLFTRPDYLTTTFDVIIHEDGCFWMWSEKYQHRCLLYEAATQGIYTKVGNKYEHPSLLEQAK